MAQGISVVLLHRTGYPASFYCPVCGHPLWGYGCRGRRACPHVLFSFIAEVPEVSFHRAGLEGKDLLYKKRCGGGWL